jgi:hypothetical protein
VSDQPTARGSFTIDEWCEHRRVKRSTYYKMRQLGQGPRLHYALSKPLISVEADAQWQAEREAEAANDRTS